MHPQMIIRKNAVIYRNSEEMKNVSRLSITCTHDTLALKYSQYKNIYQKGL